MDKDYRLQLLSFLKENYPKKVNISPLVKKYINETNNPRQYYRDTLDKLHSQGYIIASLSDLDKLSTSRGGVYNDELILVGLTHSGLDEFARIKKQEYDLSNSERVYKTYFSTRLMAIAGFIIGFLLFLLKIAEVLKWLP